MISGQPDADLLAALKRSEAIRNERGENLRAWNAGPAERAAYDEAARVARELAAEVARRGLRYSP